jgi:IS5 family transposase
MLPDVLHAGERTVWGDGGHQGQADAIYATSPLIN